MRCQQVLSGAANNGNSTVVHASYNNIGYTVYCTGCDLVILDDSFYRVQLITNISGCRSQITAITLCPIYGKICAVCAHCVYILTPQSTILDDEYPLTWSLSTTLQIGSPVTCATFNNTGSELLVAGSQMLVYETKKWACLWSTHLTEETSQVTVSPDGRFFTTLSNNSKILKLWKKSKHGKDYRSELIPHPDVVIGACWRQIPRELPKDSVRQVLLTSCLDCIGRIWLETPQIHPSISVRHATTKSLVLGTVLDPLKEATENLIPGSPYIYQWFNNKAHSFSACIDNALLIGEMMLSEAVSVSSYDDVAEAISDELGSTLMVPLGDDNVDLKVRDMKEYKYTVSQLLKIWYQSFDLVICVSPSTGSLMGWRVEKIDISYPFQALTTRFVLKLPWSLTYADARILKPSFEVFSTRKTNCNSQKQRSMLRSKSRNSRRSQAKTIPELANTLVDTKSVTLPTVCLLTSHTDGTVNLFTFELELDDVTYTDISNLVHEVRCSGHRCPPLKSLSHPYIPLVLTTSCETGTIIAPGYGELILWRVSCIGPMTTRKTGILELARVDTKRAADFTEVSWFPKAFSVIPQSAKEYAGVLTSFVLHFVAFTGYSLELYRVITLSESLQTAKMILNRTSSVPCDMIGETQLRSKSSGSGASKIYHVGRIADVTGSCSLLHTFSLSSVQADSFTSSMNESYEEYFVVMVDSNHSNEATNSVHTIQVAISKEDMPGTNIQGPIKVQQVHDSFFCARWETVKTHCLPVPDNISILHCSPAADTVATPKFVPPGIQAPYIISALCSDSIIRFYSFNNEADIWSPWPNPSLQNTEFRLERSTKDTYICNSIPGRLAVSQTADQVLSVLMFECESSGGACWVLEDSLTLGPATEPGPVFMDWMSAANGTHILALCYLDNLWILTPCSCISLHSAAAEAPHYLPSQKIESWVALLRVTLNTNGPALPRSLSWNSTGSLLLGINSELQLFSPWYTREEVTMLDTHSHLEQGVGNVYNDALSLQPRLPQYHPYVLRQLIDNRKVSEVKLILHCLLRYLYSYHRSSKHRLAEVSNVVDIIPPLPLHDLYNMLPDMFSADESVNDDSEQGDYSALFATASYLDDSDDDQGIFSDEEEHSFIRQRSIAHSESEYGGILSFDAKRAGELDSYLSHYQLPGLTREEQLSLSCLAITVGSTSQAFSDDMHSQPIGQDLDDCGLRFTLELIYQNSISQRSEKHPLKPNDYIWAFHSSCQTQLIAQIPGFTEKTLTWEGLRCVGVGWWVKSTPELKNLIEIVCKTRFQTTKNPLECALFYLAMKKKSLLQSLYRTVRDNKMATFFKHDFNEARWKTAAKKNAFVLLSQQRYEHAAAFFLLADSLEDALELVLKYCADPQLALVIARLYEQPQTSADNLADYNICFKRILSTHILGKPLLPTDPTAGALMTLKYNDNPFLCSMAHWWLGHYQSALYCLLRPATIHNSPQATYILPNVFSFYCYLYHHPLLRKCKDPIRIPFSIPDNISNDVKGVIALERRMIFITAHTQFNMGCPTLSLDVLKHLEHGFTKESDATLQTDVSLCATSQITTGMLTTEAVTLETSMSITPTFTVDAKAETLNDTSWMEMNYGAPAKTSRYNLDEEYEIDFSSNSDSESSDNAATPITSLDTTGQSYDLDGNNTETEDIEQKATDPFIVQIQLKCCIKILADELRFLPHALLDQFDPELGPFGGRAKLRVKMDSGASNPTSSTAMPPRFVPPGANRLGLKVCQWLKNEIDTVSRLCNLKYSQVYLCDIEESEAEKAMLNEVAHFTFKLEESVLTVLLLFCILHGDLNYNLAALRLELLFLLQEFHGAGDLSALIRTMDQSTTTVDLPPLLTTTAPPPLLLTPLNMLWQLTGHTLKLINRCTVQHNIPVSEIEILNSLSLSASACMWQCLALRHGSTRIPDSYAIVKHRPLSWPGLSGYTVFFLVSAGKAFLVNKEREGALPIAIVLVEAIISVFLGLYLYACSHSDAAMMTLLMYNVPCIDIWTKVTGTTVQSVDTSSPRAHKKRVSIMGERIRVKGPRMSDKNVVTVRETFLPPTMSLVEYFKREQPIDTSNMFEVESDCEETLDDDGDDPDNFDSYSWYLMRLLSVVYVQDKISAFLGDIGLSSSEIGGMSPLLASTIKTLDLWVEDLQQKLDANYPEGAPPDLLPPTIPSYTLLQSVADPINSPFRQLSKSSLPARILWHKLATDTDMVSYLEKAEVEGHADGREAETSGVRTVFRSHEGVSSFACYQNTLSLMVVTTPHEILELDVKTWLERDSGIKVVEGGEEDVCNSPFIIISAEESNTKTRNATLMNDQYGSDGGSMEVFNQVLKRSEQGVRCAEAHNDLPLYITGHSDGYVKLWEFGYPHHLAKYGLTGTRGRVTNVHFGPLGAKFGLSDTNGVVGLWHTTVNSTTPYCVLNCHDRAARDFAFLGSASVIASVGSSSNSRNVVIWDTLLPPSECAVKKFQAHDMGAMVCCYSPKRQLLVSGGNKGDICVFDVRQRKLQHMFTAHDNAVRSICLRPDEEAYFTGSVEGDIKSWSFGTGGTTDQHIFTGGHKSNKFFSNLPGGSLKGVMKLQIDSTNHLISCGADGEVKLRRLAI